ncbi:MAG: thiol-disulfide isomerase/thioredoxin [Chlamydiales bacterium]
MLINTVAQRYEGQVKVVSEDFGASELAERFGVKRYPAVFVNDVLIAKPKDFGFFGTSGSQGSGRYTPWLKEESHERFSQDLDRILQQAISGELESFDPEMLSEEEITALPELEGKDLLGQVWNSKTLRETVTIVDFWATWCPPCIKALPWLVELQEQHPGRLQILSVAIESKVEDVQRISEVLHLPFPTLLGTPELARSFGDLTSVPTMFIFASGGRLIDVIYGAPPGLHDQVEALLADHLDNVSGGR